MSLLTRKEGFGVSTNIYNILIVDDMLENIKILENILNQENYKISITNYGRDALKMVEQEEFDLIMLDIMMPDISGLEVCRYLKIDPKTSNIPVIFLTGSQDKNVLTKAFNVGGIDYIKKPYFKEELLARVKAALKIRHYEKNLEDEIKQRTKDMEDAQVYLMNMLGGVAEGHSIETYKHVQRVSEVTYLLAKYYGMNEKEAETLKHASYLHDIGKIGVKDYILHKKEKLSHQEFEEIKKHPNIGASMLEGVKLPLFEIAKIVSKEHHEKYNGKGYPKGLKGESIHIYARIVAIADVFDALASKRSYKKGWSMNETLDFFKEERGKHFDAHLIDIFFAHIDDFLALYGTNMQNLEAKEPQKTKKTRSKIMEWLLKEL